MSSLRYSVIDNQGKVITVTAGKVEYLYVNS